MTHLSISPETPCRIADFDPDADMLVFALPEDASGGLEHSLAFRHDPARDLLEVTLHHHASGARFRVHLPGLRALSPDAIAVLTLDPPPRARR